MALPRFADVRTESDLPKPLRTDKLEPTLTTLRIDSELPIWNMSKTDTEDPRRANLLTENEAPICALSMTDRVLPPTLP